MKPRKPKVLMRGNWWFIVIDPKAAALGPYPTREVAEYIAMRPALWGHGV